MQWTIDNWDEEERAAILQPIGTLFADFEAVVQPEQREEARPEFVQRRIIHPDRREAIRLLQSHQEFEEDVLRAVVTLLRNNRV